MEITTNSSGVRKRTFSGHSRTCSTKRICREGDITSQKQSAKQFPGLITGKLPVELDLEIYKYLSARDIANLSSTCRTARSVVEAHGRSTALSIIDRQKERLKKAVSYMDFAGLSFVTAWHRYIENFGLARDLMEGRHIYQDDSQFIDAYLLANGPLRKVNDNDNADDTDDDTEDDDDADESEKAHRGYLATSVAILSISDWLLCCDNGLKFTPHARIIQDLDWSYAVAAATGYGGYKEEYAPGRYGDLIDMFHDGLDVALDPLFIVQAFDEVKARPLDDLEAYASSLDDLIEDDLVEDDLVIDELVETLSRPREWPVDDSESEEESEIEAREEIHDSVRRVLHSQSAILSSNLEPRDASPSLEYSDDDFQTDLRHLREQIGLPENVNGFHVFLWASHRKTKQLMKGISRGKQGKNVLRLAALLSELDVFFR